LRAFEILQGRPGVTAGELAAVLGVTARAARRYAGILREAGIPVERPGPLRRLPARAGNEAASGGLYRGRGAEPGHGGAWQPAGCRRRRRRPRRFRAGQGHPGTARERRPASRGAAGAHLGRAGLGIRHARTPPSPACSSHPSRPGARADHLPQRVRGEWQAEVDPWAVVARCGCWYLLCHPHHAGVVRTCRADRVRAVRQTARTFEPSRGLDPVAALEEHLGTGWEFPTRVVFDAPPAEVAPWIRPPMERLEPSGDRCVLVGSTSNPAMYAQGWLAGVPLAFSVEGGQELRAAIAALASRLAAALDGGAGRRQEATARKY